MKKVVSEAIKHITLNPQEYKPLGNSEFGGFGNDTYELYFAGNSIGFGLLSIIHLKAHGVDVNTTRHEKMRLENLNRWWWENVPTGQLAVNQ